VKAKAKKPIETLIMLESALGNHGLSLDHFLAQDTSDPLERTAEAVLSSDIMSLRVFLGLADREGSQTSSEL
jgi:hypothetical protein